MALHRADERPGPRAGSSRTASTPDVEATIRNAQRAGNQGVAMTPEAHSKVLRALMTGDDTRR